MALDEKGFLWIGCDAGLYKFDGLHYIPYKCATQHSKSISNLHFSSSGTLYCFNFQSQIFYLQGDSLRELESNLFKVNQLACDNSGNVYITHNNGISRYNETKRTWQHFGQSESRINLFSSVVNALDTSVLFIEPKGLSTIANNKIEPVVKSEFQPVGNFILRKAQNRYFVLNTYRNQVIEWDGNRLSQNKELEQILLNRKVTNAVYLPDSTLWICTYKGLIRYILPSQKTELFYPEISFTDVLLDREGNYWFSTLQAGLLRIANLSYTVWNRENPELENEKITKLSSDGLHLYFTTVNGMVGKLNSQTGELKSFKTGQSADPQSLDYSSADKRLYFNINGRLCFIQNDKLGEKPNSVSTIKSYQKIGTDYLMLSSYGVHVEGDTSYKISESWSRELFHDTVNQMLWIASNDGISLFYSGNRTWKPKAHFLPRTQILSLAYQAEKQSLFALSFDGQIHQYTLQGKPQSIAQIPEQVQANKIRIQGNRAYIASNKGVWILDLNTQNWTQLNTLSGLASENVQDLVVLDKQLWLATGKGLQAIPLLNAQTLPLARIYLKALWSRGEQDHHAVQDPAQVTLFHGDELILLPEANAYASNGKYDYAYRINGGEWVLLPSGIEKLELQNLPTGDLAVELKLIDHLGRDSENTLSIAGIVNPPFWKTAWFIALSAVLVGFMGFLLIRWYIAQIRKREREKTELLNSQLKAIRAQMNPHFMYNTLNSIQDLILQNDIKNTNYYLSKFSALMRQILAFSEEEKILLSEEMEMLGNYLELEKLRFGTQFSFALEAAPQLDAERIFIPSLIVQPFVENAIKHGLLHKKGAKNLVVQFEQLDGILSIRIEDNGVGRTRSQEINQRSSLNHKSFSTQAVQKRIDLLNKGKQFHISVEVADLYPAEHDRGTRVQIRVSQSESKLD